MNKRALLALLLSLCLFSAAHAVESLVLGVVPYLSSRKLATLYEPLRVALEKEQHQPVLMESATDYSYFLERTRLGRYDIIATSPSFGRLAELEQNYQPLARPLTDLEPLLVVRATDSTTLAQLRNKTISTSDQLATLSLAAHRYLVQSGFTPGMDITIKPTGSHANSLAALLNQESAAAIISVSSLHQFGPEMASKIKVLAHLPNSTPLLYLGHKRLGKARLQQLQQQLLGFANNTPQGKAFSEELKHDGLRPVSKEDMLALDPFVKDLRGLIKQ